MTLICKGLRLNTLMFQLEHNSILVYFGDIAPIWRGVLRIAVMPRTKHELEIAKDRLTRAVDLLHKELESIEMELSALAGHTKLDRVFFWEQVVPLLLSAGGGLSSAELYNILRDRGFAVSQAGLRVFLSRHKVRGALELATAGLHGPRWRPSASTIERAIKLGYRPDWFE
jgi:hypothetical protein